MKGRARSLGDLPRADMEALDVAAEVDGERPRARRP